MSATSRAGRAGRATCVAAAALLVAALAACSGSTTSVDPGPAEPVSTALPSTLTAFFDQDRVDRVGRAVYVRLVDDGPGTVTVTGAEVSSDRFPTMTWTGEKTFQNEADLDLELPPASCGAGSDADVRLTYRLDDGPELVSTTTATDRYGAIGLFLDRDCAAQRLSEAADLTVGEHRVVGEGRDSVFELPVTLTPTGGRDDVSFAGFGDTVLFQAVDPTPVFPAADPVPLAGGAPVELLLRLVPGRCDPHALAEDKVGTLVFVHVDGPDLPEAAHTYLPISDEARGDLRGFFTTHCGFG